MDPSPEKEREVLRNRKSESFSKRSALLRLRFANHKLRERALGSVGVLRERGGQVKTQSGQQERALKYQPSKKNQHPSED